MCLNLPQCPQSCKGDSQAAVALFWRQKWKSKKRVLWRSPAVGVIPRKGNEALGAKRLCELPSDSLCKWDLWEKAKGENNLGNRENVGGAARTTRWPGRPRQSHKDNPLLGSTRLLFLLSASKLMPAPTDCSLKYMVVLLCPAELCFSDWLHCQTPPEVEERNSCCFHSTVRVSLWKNK